MFGRFNSCCGLLRGFYVLYGARCVCMCAVRVHALGNGSVRGKLPQQNAGSEARLLVLGPRDGIFGMRTPLGKLGRKLREET